MFVSGFFNTYEGTYFTFGKHTRRKTYVSNLKPMWLIFEYWFKLNYQIDFWSLIKIMISTCIQLVEKITILFLLQEILKSAQQEDRELRYFCVDNVCMKTGNKVYKFPLYRSWKAGERLLSTSIARTCASASLHRWWRWLETVVCLYVGCLRLCSSSPVMKLVRAVTIEPDT